MNIRVDDGLWEHPIPKLILQPLVEYAMIHGVVPNERKGLIEVLLEDRGDWVNVTVGDDRRRHRPGKAARPAGAARKTLYRHRA